MRFPNDSAECMFVLAVLLLPCNWSTSLMSSSLLLQQCPACLFRLTWIVFVIGGRWPYSWCLVGCCRQDLFKIAQSILMQLPSSFFSSRFVSVQVVHPHSSIDTTAAWKKLRFILSVRSDFQMIDSLLIAVHAFANRVSMSFPYNHDHWLCLSPMLNMYLPVVLQRAFRFLVISLKKKYWPGVQHGVLWFSLIIYLYHSSVLGSPLNCIQCLHRANVNKSFLVDQNWRIHV